MAPSGASEELAALAAEGSKTAAFLRGLDLDGWHAPTRCAPLGVREIVVHMLVMVEYMGKTAAKPPVSEVPVKDRVTWWDYDIEEDQAETLRWIEKATNDYPAGPLADRWSTAVDRCVESLRAAAADGDPVVRPGDNPILLSDYAATRVLEVTIHTMDVLDAFGFAPDPSPEGLAVTLGILARRLGADPLAMGFDGADFAVLSTGRRPLTDDDRSRLGAAVERLPLLA